MIMERIAALLPPSQRGFYGPAMPPAPVHPPTDPDLSEGA
jgi:hypothetical protein